ncbi:MAG TPA: TetR/AcrR family transcriptional regulator [Lachnospiraceae bacterium]|nr:TetR/AcrR family transcriptional regulator [Lachnospiraceae bacterium]HCR83641.1 TetR/AcrR family transcriptional regulator [Lachnospiraceae bacterium]
MNEQFIQEGAEILDTRIKAIVEAATLLFLRQGYARTQISHIAKAIDVSVGTIYHDFAGKKEIMHFVLKCTIDPDFINKEFERPITDNLFSGVENEIVSLLEQSQSDFAKHLENDIESYSFEALISDAFDILARYAAGCLFIEKNQFEFPFLAKHYKACRRKFLDTMSRYLTIFIDNGTVRPMEYLELTTTLIIEILTWWAMDRRYTSFETSDIPLELAKKICVDNILSAYRS